MNKINQEKQYVISKMENILLPYSYENKVKKNIQFSNFENKLSIEEAPISSFTGNTNEILTFQAHYRFEKLGITIEKSNRLAINHEGRYGCSSCKKIVKKIYSGYCYVCLMKRASADMCILNPHRCHFLNGTCREPEWGLNYCYQPHFVYLSFTDKYKVGITRKNQILTRWVDQGATIAAPICLVSSRHQAGLLEKALTEILADKSHWQKMLKAGNQRPTDDEFSEKINFSRYWLKNLLQKNSEIISILPDLKQQELSSQKNIIEFIEATKIIKIDYPIPTHIEKIKSISLEKEKKIEGEVTGIKGQYIFFGDRVLNVRSHEGFIVDLESY
jgi:hypothetical protein